MSNIPITQGTGASSVATETVAGIDFQKIQLWGAGGSSVAGISPDGSLRVSVIGSITVAAHSVAGVVGASVVGVALLADQDNITSGFQGLTTMAQNYLFNGTKWDRWRGNSSVGAIVTPLTFPASWISGVTSTITQTTPASVLSAAGGTIKNYVTHIIVTNAAAVGTFVDIKDGGGNVMYSGYAAASGGGFVANPYPPLIGSANKSVDAAPRAQASIIVAMTGYTA